MIERTLLIKTRLGLHARAAAKLVRVASGFGSRIQLQRLDGQGAAGQCADAKSILSVLMLAASCGTELRASAEGSDEEAAINAIDQLFAAGFGELDPESPR
jgi:phosphotransferase system HPr (HPr) family protein